MLPKKRKREDKDKDNNSKPTKIAKKSKDQKFELPPVCPSSLKMNSEIQKGWVGKEKIRAATGESMGKDNLFYYSPSGQYVVRLFPFFIERFLDSFGP